MPPRNRNGRYLKVADSAERDAEALRMRSRGATLQQISDSLRYGGHANVSRAIARAVQAVAAPDALAYYLMQMEQIDDLTARAYEVLDGRHLVVSEGRVVKDVDDVPLVDPGPTLAAIDRVIKLMERRSKLMGLDAAIKLDATVRETTQADLELDELLREARAANAAAAAQAAVHDP